MNSIPSRWIRTVLCGLVLGLLPLTAASVRAEGGPDAQQRYEEGVRYYKSGQYGEAIESFQAAYQAAPDPLYLYNIAQAHRLSGQPQQAVTMYERFLRDAPQSELRPKVEGYLLECRGQIERKQKEQEAREKEAREAAAAHPVNGDGRVDLLQATAGAAPARQPLYKKWWLWTIVGTVVVGGVVAGAVLGSRAGSGPAGETYSPTF